MVVSRRKKREFLSCVPPLVKVGSFSSQLPASLLQEPFFAINTSEAIPQPFLFKKCCLVIALGTWAKLSLYCRGSVSY